MNYVYIQSVGKLLATSYFHRLLDIYFVVQDEKENCLPDFQAEKEWGKVGEGG